MCSGDGMETGLGWDYDSDSVGWKLQLMTNDQGEGSDDGVWWNAIVS